MANDQPGKYKERPFFAPLAFLFRGRVKYAVVILLLLTASLPLVVPGSIFSGFLGLPPVAAVCRFMGYCAPEDVTASREPGKPGPVLPLKDEPLAPLKSKTACKGAGCGGGSPLDLIDGKVPRTSGRVPPDGIAGAADPDPYAGAAAVRFGKAPPGRKAEGRAGAWLGQQSGPSGVVSPNESLFSHALERGEDGIPMPGRPQRVGSGYTGKVSAFSWKDVGKKGAALNKMPGSRRPMSQLAQTYSVTDSASKAPRSRPESQAGYTGAVYDGNDIDLAVLSARSAAELPDSGFIDDLGAERSMKELADRCSTAQTRNGARMSLIGREIDDLQAGMGAPPSCSGNVQPWNQKAARLYQLCVEFNRNQQELGKACQSRDNSRMNCGVYTAAAEDNGLVVKPCGKQRTGLARILNAPAALVDAVASRFRSR